MLRVVLVILKLSSGFSVEIQKWQIQVNNVEFSHRYFHSWSLNKKLLQWMSLVFASPSQGSVNEKYRTEIYHWTVQCKDNFCPSPWGSGLQLDFLKDFVSKNYWILHPKSQSGHKHSSLLRARADLEGLSSRVYSMSTSTSFRILREYWSL